MNNAEQDNLDRSLESRQIETRQENESTTGTTNRLLIYNFTVLHCYLDTDQTQSSIFDLLIYYLILFKDYSQLIYHLLGKGFL